MLKHDIKFELDDAAWALSDDEAEILSSLKQYYTAGFMRGSDIPLSMRFANAISSHLRNCAFHAYQGGKLFPSTGMIWLPPDAPQILWNFYVELGRFPNVADDLIRDASSNSVRDVLEKAKICAETYPRGGGYTHSIPNYGRILKEGLSSYRQRVIDWRDSSWDLNAIDLYNALMIVIDAIDAFRCRVVSHLDSLHFDDIDKERNKNVLSDALKSGLPMRPASGFYEAMVSLTFIYALDGPDNLGRFDQFMLPYYENDIQSGNISRDQVLLLIKELWQYIDSCSAWNTAIGGTARDGSDGSSDLTLLCMEAAHGRRRPNLALRLRNDTPDSVFDSALDCIMTGAGLPAIYCEENYIKAMKNAELGLSEADMYDYAFGGCTELMVHGCSNVGSLEGDFNVLKELEDSLYRNLSDTDSFDDLLSKFESDMKISIDAATSWMNHNQEMRSLYDPLLIRTLMIDDCIDKGLNYSNGGARYNWSIVNIVGLSNAIDSLSAIRKNVFDEKNISADRLLNALKNDFNGYDDIQTALRQSPKFGNDDHDVNVLANRLSKFIYREFMNRDTWRGGKFLCGTLMFVTYGMFGLPVGATADGRYSGTPIGDSAGPVQGRDTKGPTAMLSSTASLDQIHAPGTLVVNLRVSRHLVSSVQGREKLKSLIKTYFNMGGLQLQVNVVDQEILKDAIAHPEKHNDLIIRVGGYSEYFNLLSDDLKYTILERTEHS